MILTHQARLQREQEQEAIRLAEERQREVKESQREAEREYRREMRKLKKDQEVRDEALKSMRRKSEEEEQKRAAEERENQKEWELARREAEERRREFQARWDSAEEQVRSASQVRELVARILTDTSLYSDSRLIYLGPDSASSVDTDIVDLRGFLSDVLDNANYPLTFPRDHDLSYDSATGILVVDYVLPVPSDLPTLKEVRVKRDSTEIIEKHITAAEHTRLYDTLVYGIVLRTIHELFAADKMGALTAAVFNGYVRSTDPATGQPATPCIVSLHANKAEFQSINLANVDPKACFRHFKGVGSSKLHALVPVVPILGVSTEDKRFIQSRPIVSSVDEGNNLASMDWEDFEHLVREVLENEFAANGGEVRVTRASRDGGIDAVAFDPDPIRGGKIAIQAKRYTNTVGVAAVRDLYGTIINEGAMKGIMVTTANYGPDAYEFAKGKPITLLNGGHLLYLLEKHGHRAHIDLEAAKRVLAESQLKSGPEPTSESRSEGVAPIGNERTGEG